MQKFKWPMGLIALAAVIVLGFQNCGMPGSSSGTNMTLQYQSISPVNAQNMIAAYESMCTVNAGASAGFPVLAADSVINVAGSQTGRATTISSIQGTGNLVLFGTAAGALIADISGFSGNLTLCNISVGAISGTTVGNISVENGTVTSLNDFSGNLYLMNSTFPASVANSPANILVRTTGGLYYGRSYIP